MKLTHTCTESNVCRIYVATARKMLANHLLSHLQPWLLDDMHSILNEPEAASVRGGKYIGIHVRRGDKIRTSRGSLIESEARSL